MSKEKMLKIFVRRATLEDYQAVCELFDEIDAYHRENLPHIFKKHDGPAREPEYFSGLMADENVGMFVAETGEKMVGFVNAVIRETPDVPIFVPRRIAVIDNIVVRSAFRSQGIGKLLAEKIEAWAVEKRAGSIELNVYEFNEKAVSFYEKLGYQTVSRRMSKDILS